MEAQAIGIILAAAAVAGFIGSLVLTRAARRFATRVGFVDRPQAHKPHAAPIPYGGGSAILAATLAPLALLLIAISTLTPEWIEHALGESLAAYAGGAQARSAHLLVILGGGVALHLLGLLDDLRPQGPRRKLLAMTLIGALVSWLADVRIAQFDFMPAGASIALSVAWIVVITNAFNFLDNMDGLSAGIALICCAALAACGVLAGQVLVPALALLLAGALCGFLIFNFPPASIYMGDSGSLLIGYLLAVISVRTSYYDSGAGLPPFALAMPLVVLALPLYDFVTVISIRLSEGRNPMRGDQRHFSHRLREHGLSKRGVVLTIYLATGVAGLAATLMPGASLRETMTILAIVVGTLLVIAILETPPRRES